MNNEPDEMKVDVLALRRSAAKLKTKLDAELDRLEKAWETQMSPLAKQRLSEMAAIAALSHLPGASGG